ncbi:MAG TPA: FIST N-terminal domain-containing protein [Candidatus Thiothrix moscowensis]|uniref:FIST signal transduction protein n=1 Tax=unclassified Thiothrix TaxID=2636184 RepID=UPI0025CD2F70|nr:MULTISPECIES: FIST N-terminal domain-containing protein [unclassified Thiothrix]HRJ53015.1 FIST N-terminal domain-containing protein [Candidatus Thiothrix moscowensis]HRJ92941.1 FIST N-terminal domain-containing protein [Candidatus Thiothrix moscowensis]
MQVVLTYFTQATGWQKPLPAFDSPGTLVLIFSEPDIKPYQQALDELQAKYPRSVIAGCSTLSSIYNDTIMENALVVGIIRFHKTRLAIAFAELNSPQESKQAGISIASSLNNDDLKGILVLTDGLNTQGCDLISGMASLINQQQVTVVGGLSSDHLQFRTTWVLCDGLPASHMVCGIGFYGEHFVIASQAKDGFKPFGPERMITRATGRILHEIDGRPALQLYKEYLGEHANDLPAACLRFPLAVWQHDRRHYVVRTPVAVDEENNSLTFVADVPDGYQIQLMYGSFDNLVEGAENAARSLIHRLPPSTPALALTISCSGRKMVMQEDTYQELEATLENLPQGSQQFGFYSYGEIAPTAQGTGWCSLHNETMTLTVLYEGD